MNQLAFFNEIQLSDIKPAPTFVVAEPTVPPKPKRRERAPRILDPHTDAPKEITRLLLKCGYEGRWYCEIFDDWLDAVEIALDRLPSFFNQAAGGEPLQDPPDIAERWQRIAKHYKPQTLEYFAEAFAVLLDATDDGAGNPTYADCLGSVFMEFVVPSDAKYRGQFFTPFTIARMMAQMQMGEIECELHERIDAALAHSATYQLGKLLGATITLETKLSLLDDVREHFQPITIDDPACGSGVLLLAAAFCCPRWAIVNRLVEFYAIDIDRTCVQMTRINFRLYGLNECGYLLRDAA